MEQHEKAGAVKWALDPDTGMPLRRPAKLTGSKRRQKVATLLLRDGNLCALCKVVLTEETATIDHIRPRALGGPNANTNLQLLCKDCNHSKGHK